MYLMKNLPSTPVSTLEKAHKIAIEEGLHYAYVGNVPGHRAENTYCPKCQNTIVQRGGYTIQKLGIVAGRCENCSTPIPGIWS